MARPQQGEQAQKGEQGGDAASHARACHRTLHGAGQHWLYVINREGKEKIPGFEKERHRTLF